MNFDKAEQLASAIDSNALDMPFGMESMRTCIAAHAVALFAPKEWETLQGHCGNYDRMQEAATNILELTPEEARELFFADSSERDLEDLTRHSAVAVLKHARICGIDWGSAL